MKVLKTLEELTNQSNLKAGITDFDDAVFLVETLPPTTKNTLLRKLNLSVGTSNSQLANLILADKEGRTIEIQELPKIDMNIENIDDEPLGQNITDNELKNLIEGDFEDDGDTEGQGKGEGKREGERKKEGKGKGEGEEEGEGEGEGKGEGEAEFEEDGESEGEGGKDGEGEAEGEDKGEEQSEEEKNQEDKVRNELLEYGYQPPYFFLTRELLEKGIEKKTTEYVQIEKVFENTTKYRTKYSIVITPNDNSTPSDNSFDLGLYLGFKEGDVRLKEGDDETSTFIVDIAVNYTKEGEDTRALFELTVNTLEKSMFSNLFNKAYADAIKIFNSQLIQEAEKNQKFIENINK